MKYVPLHTAAAFSSDGADWNTDFVRQGLEMERISFQISQGFQVLSLTAKSSKALGAVGAYVCRLWGLKVFGSQTSAIRLVRSGRTWHCVSHGAVSP